MGAAAATPSPQGLFLLRLCCVCKGCLCCVVLCVQAGERPLPWKRRPLPLHSHPSLAHSSPARRWASTLLPHHMCWCVTPFHRCNKCKPNPAGAGGRAPAAAPAECLPARAAECHGSHLWPRLPVSHGCYGCKCGAAAAGGGGRTTQVMMAGRHAHLPPAHRCILGGCSTAASCSRLMSTCPFGVTTRPIMSRRQAAMDASIVQQLQASGSCDEQECCLCLLWRRKAMAAAAEAGEMRPGLAAGAGCRLRGRILPTRSTLVNPAALDGLQRYK